MPDFTYHGLTGKTYPESRQSDGDPVGTVEPGETRDLPGPLDEDWHPAKDSEDQGSGEQPKPAKSKAPAEK